MKRLITSKLIKWKTQPGRKPLLVRGARQVGKTYSVIDFAKNYFEGDIHIFNFEKNPEIHSIFLENLDCERILAELELISNKTIKPEYDLLFFDEIQECPKAIMSLRYFYEEKPDLHLIAAGSLLEFALKDISFPVGRLQMLYMQPMTFEEFLIANDKSLLAEKITQRNTQLSESAIKLINNELYKYFIVGGMPECVKTYLMTKSFIAVSNVQSDLLATYRQDFSKYAEHADKRCLISVLNSVAIKTGEQIKYSKLAEDFSNPTIKKAFDLLETARLFTKVRAANPSGLPLGANISEKKFKTVFLDIGLLSNINGFYSDKTISKQKFQKAFNGKMAEQFVGQELRTYTDNQIFYWAREAKSSNAEVDYVVEIKNEIIPIEVKSGKHGSLKSLHLMLSSYPNIQNACVLNEDKYGNIEENKIHFLPLFHAASIPSSK